MRTQGYLAFAVGICLTFWICVKVMDAQQESIRGNFQRDADKVANDTSVRLQTYFDMLLSIKGAFAINESVNRAQFAHYVRELNLNTRYPGFQAIQFVRAVPHAELTDFIGRVRHDTTLNPEGYPQFEVHPLISRHEHLIIEFTEPMKGNENAFGLDLAALAPHRAAVEEGRDSGEVVATERITLVQDARSGEPGFVARAPVYRPNMPLNTVAERRAAFVGSVAIVFRVSSLMREVIEPDLLNHMTIRIHDIGNRDGRGAPPPSPGNVMFDSTRAGLAPIAGMQAELPVTVAQRQWVMSFRPLAGRRYSQDFSRVLSIGAGGVTISALIAALLIASGRRRKLTAQLSRTLDEQRAAQVALVAAKEGLEHSLAQLEQQKAAADTANRDLSGVLTKLQSAQASLITSEKMAALGALVAGIAHELNTPIGNSLLTATALSDMVTEFEKKYIDGAVRRSTLDAHIADTRLACDIMAGSLRRAADLINSFKQVAVDQTSDQRRRFDLCDVVRDTFVTYAGQLRRANCETALDAPDHVLLDSYPGSLGQVLSNLINNALLHAFEGRAGGLITVNVRETEDQQVVMVFSDNGIGMTPRVLNQIFDPFFTTKMGQGGSGLGMNIVYNIVTRTLGGSIDITSSDGQGTSVTIRIPIAAPISESPATAALV